MAKTRERFKSRKLGGTLVEVAERGMGPGHANILVSMRVNPSWWGRESARRFAQALLDAADEVDARKGKP